MTPDVQAAIDDIEYCCAQAELFEVPAVTVDTAKLRTLLAALDPAEQPIDRVPTPKALDYLETRREQHPRSVRDFRGITGPT